MVPKAETWYRGRPLPTTIFFQPGPLGPNRPVLPCAGGYISVLLAWPNAGAIEYILLAGTEFNVKVPLDLSFDFEKLPPLVRAV